MRGEGLEKTNRENVLNLINCWLKKMQKKRKTPDIRNRINFKWMHFRMKCDPNHTAFAWFNDSRSCMCVWKCIYFWLHIVISWKILHHLHFFTGLRPSGEKLWYMVTVILFVSRIYSHCIFSPFRQSMSMVWSIFWAERRHSVRDFHIYDTHFAYTSYSNLRTH